MSESLTNQSELVIEAINYADFSTPLLEMMLKKHLERAASLSSANDIDAVTDKAFDEAQAIKLELALQQRRV